MTKEERVTRDNQKEYERLLEIRSNPDITLEYINKLRDKGYKKDKVKQIMEDQDKRIQVLEEEL